MDIISHRENLIVFKMILESDNEKAYNISR